MRQPRGAAVYIELDRVHLSMSPLGLSDAFHFVTSALGGLVGTMEPLTQTCIRDVNIILKVTVRITKHRSAWTRDKNTNLFA